VAAVGHVREIPRLELVDVKGRLVSWKIADLEKSWRGGMTV
jgi:hypothetical protein